MMKITKIEDKSLNLDVQGQGCWNDCFIGAHWESKANGYTPGCVWKNDDYTSKSSFVM